MKHGGGTLSVPNVLADHSKPLFPGHKYFPRRCDRPEDCQPLSASRVCHELMLDPEGYSLAVSPLAPGSIIDQLDVFVVSTELRVRPIFGVSFDCVKVLLEHCVGSLRALVRRAGGDVQSLLLSDGDMLCALEGCASPWVVFGRVFEDMMESYGALCRSDSHLWDVSGGYAEFCLLRDFLVAVLDSGSGERVPSFSDAMARSEGVFQGRIEGFRQRWAEFQGGLEGLADGEVVERWCDALRCIRCACCRRRCLCACV